MPHFSRRLETEQGHLSFYFNRIVTAEGTRYHVSVIGRDHKAYTFFMQERGSNWVMTDTDVCPPWIVAMEKTFEKEIIQNLMYD